MSSDSPSDLPEPQHKPKRRIGCFSIGLIGLICVVAFVFAAFLVWRSASTKRLNTALAALKAGGHPTNGEELMKTYPMPDKANPGPLWTKAGESLEDSGPSISKLPFIGAEADEPVLPGQPWDQLEPTRAYLEKHADAIAMAERAARSKTVARYDAKFVWDGPEDSTTSLPYMNSHRHICRVMGMAAFVHAHDGNPAGVAKSVETAMRVSHSLADEPSSMGQRISTACGSIALSHLRDFISLDFEDEQLEQLQATIREFNPQKSLLRGLEGETVLVVSNFKNRKLLGPIPRNEDAAFLVEQIVPFMEVVKKGDWADIRKEAASITNTVERTEGGPNASRYFISTHTLPSILTLSVAKTREAAILSVYDTLIAARRFELANDRLPESIDELVPKFLPAIPTDPFSDSGEPLILKTEDSVTKIYSRGADTKDDDGDGDLAENNSYTIDIVRELKRAKKPITAAN